ncbi:alpha/beta hydrolase-fold protein [Nocardia sp. NPDC050712]|uniref:alpha/beta hydrolase n=1 Tax=Nocardia sp. NPDC050712 TaxID=3155518 RepID=UPI0033FFB5B8
MPAPTFARSWHRLCAATGVGIALAAAPAAAQPPPPQAVSIVDRQWLTERTLGLTVATDAFADPVPVEVTFPAGYRADGAQRWPVTYYLAGTGHDQTTFRATYDGEANTASYPSIVVAPRGDAGFWSDWLDNDADRSPKYESFVIEQLIPLVDANFRTVPDRAHRAIMGESMGGFGTMLLSARHPDRFVAAASLSGVPDTNLPITWNVLSQAPLIQGGRPDAIYGPRATEEIRWRGHNPADLAGNLRGVDLQLYTGNGVYDPAHGETPVEASIGCALERELVHPPSSSMHAVLSAHGIAHHWVDMPWGCHGVALFEAQIRQATRRFEQVFADPPAVPERFDFRSIEPAFEVWGWSVRADPRRAVEFLDLAAADSGGLTITGSGRTTITTPPLPRGSGAPTVTVDGTPADVSADSDGRLTFVVELGPPAWQQQFGPGAAGATRTATVRIG